MRKIFILVFCLVACGDNYENVSIDASFTDAKINDNPCYIGSGPMPEPSTQPVWNTDATNRTTPSGGLQASGYVTNAIPTSGNLNWWKNLVYQWIGWFRTVITANGGITAVANQDIAVSGTGEFVHGDVVLQVGAAAGQTDQHETTNYWRYFVSLSGAVPNCWTQTGSGGAGVVFALPLKIGDRIKSVRAIIRDTTGSNTISMSLTDNATATPGASLVGSTQTSAGDGTVQTLQVSGLTTTVTSGHFFTVFVDSNTATGTTHAIYGVEVTYDHP